MNFKKSLIGLAAVMTAWTACSTDSSNEAEVAIKQDVVAEPLWRTFQNVGVSEYFDSVLTENGFSPIDTARRDEVNGCRASALKMDDGTIYMDELESLYMEGTLVDGVCGKALSLKSGEVAPLGVNLLDSMMVGTVEFWFRPGNDFFEESARTLLGNDGARMHFFMQGNKLIFQKNHADQHFFVEGEVLLKKDWNLIAGQWGDGYMSLWVNGELVARKAHDMGYAPARRSIPFENLVVIGYKSECCMEGAGQFNSMTTSGDFDQFRISKVLRYKYKVDSALVDSAAIDSITADSAKEIFECSELALVRDSNTLYMEDFDTSFAAGTVVDGVCGKALSLKNDENVDLGIDLKDSIAVGTVEFWFRPGEDFDAVSARTLLGNDGSRVHFMVKDGILYFQKNLADIHFFAQGKANFKDGWNLVAGQWGDGYLSVWLNGKLVGYTKHEYGYSPSLRNFGKSENIVLVGKKSSCCMEDVLQYDSMTTSGAFDQLRVSDVIRYEGIPVEPAVDTMTVEENDSSSVVVDTLTADFSVLDSNDVIVDTTVVLDSAVLED